MLYLVSGVLTETWYMNDPKPEVSVMRLVEAESEELAIEKFSKHFEDKSSEYCVDYWVCDVVAHEVIR
jgi:hypothetical protein